MKIGKVIFLSLSFAVAFNVAHADWRFEAETGGLYDSNLSNSDRASDVKDDWAWKAVATIANGWQLSRDLRLTLAADLRSRLWARFDALDTIGGGTLARLRYRFGLGSDAPWILLENRIGYDRY